MIPRTVSCFIIFFWAYSNSRAQAARLYINYANYLGKWWRTRTFVPVLFRCSWKKFSILYITYCAPKRCCGVLIHPLYQANVWYVIDLLSIEWNITICWLEIKTASFHATGEQRSVLISVWFSPVLKPQLNNWHVFFINGSGFSDDLVLIPFLLWISKSMNLFTTKLLSERNGHKDFQWPILA